jgi:hypothetical protein
MPCSPEKRSESRGGRQDGNCRKDSEWAVPLTNLPSVAIRVAGAGFSVQIVEARSRIGGRIFTQRNLVWKVRSNWERNSSTDCHPKFGNLFRSLFTNQFLAGNNFRLVCQSALNLVFSIPEKCGNCQSPLLHAHRQTPSWANTNQIQRR